MRHGNGDDRCGAEGASGMPTRRPAIAAPWRGDDNGGGGLRGRQLVPATEPSQAKRAAAAVKLTGPAANTAADW